MFVNAGPCVSRTPPREPLERRPVNTLFILNEAPYGSELTYNGVRLAASLSTVQGEQAKIFLLGDAARQAWAKGAGGFLKPGGDARPRCS